MRITKMLKQRKYVAIAIIGTAVMAIVQPLIGTRGLLNTIDLWFLTLLTTPINVVLYAAFSVLFGLLLALQFYNRKECISCEIEPNSPARANATKPSAKKAGTIGAVGTIVGFMFGVCPACVGLAGLILPLGISVTLTAWGWAFTLAAILILLFSIKLAGGFKRA